MSIDIMSSSSDKCCGSCRYFECSDGKRIDSTLVVYSDFNATGRCTKTNGKYYGRSDVGICEEFNMPCYTKGEDSTAQKIVKSVAKKAILKAIFKI